MTRALIFASLFFMIASTAQADTLSSLLGLDEALEAALADADIGGAISDIVTTATGNDSADATNDTTPASSGGCCPPRFSCCNSEPISGCCGGGGSDDGGGGNSNGGGGSGGITFINYIDIDIDIDINITVNILNCSGNPPASPNSCACVF